MRLLQYSENGELSIHCFDDGDIPPYAILSHTWGADNDEVTFADLETGDGTMKPGYKKILFCRDQAQHDNLRYFWIDTCCINKLNKAELSQAIQSMFYWYRNAARCYVYLSDVSKKKRKACDRTTRLSWEPAFRSSRWFTRGWTLQELLAPAIVEFFSQEGESLGSKTSLQIIICEITSIPSEVLNGTPLSQFSVNKRLRWAEGRTTRRDEDRAYCLQGILGIELAPVYGEGEAGAFDRLKREMYKLEQCIQDIHLTDPRDDKKRIEETKGGLLADSYRWILDNTTFRQWHKDQHSRLLWVKGDPGKGKTMLLCGIIDELQNSLPQNALLSYFFCQATDSRINTATAVLRGLLYMLVHKQRSLARHVRERYDHAGKALFEDANAWVALSEIFVSIMQDKRLEATFLVIDALDECVVDLPKLLDLIASTSTLSARVKWLVSSRNESDIRVKFKLVRDEAKLSLELKQNAEQVARAVDAYIDHKLSYLESIEEDVRKQVRDELHRKANGTFLWVALVIQELEKPESWDPLAVVAEAPAGLDQLYDRMMEQIQRLSKRNIKICQSLLCTTAIAYRPLYLAEMGSLCKLAGQATVLADTVRKIVALCGSFLTVRDEQVYLVHQSAQDYLSGKMQALILPSPSEMHYNLVTQSLDLLSSKLKRDIYGLIEPGFSINDIRIPDSDPLATVRYSCVYWVDHLYDSGPQSLPNSLSHMQVAGLVDKFLSKNYLYWLEALSLCRSMAKGVVSMTKLSHLVKALRDAGELNKVVYDAQRFIMYHKEPIENYPLQTYASALLFSPADSITRRLFQHEELREVAIKPAMSNGWSACLQTLEGHSDHVWSVAFSHDSTRLASASDDTTVKIWDASSGTCVQTLEGHSSHVFSVAFSHDSTRLASASDDTTVKIWDTSSGACVQTLEGHSSRVCSVSFSHDSTRLASASDDTTVKIWDTSSGTCVQTLEGHSSHVCSVAFSHDSTRLASASDDTTVKIWDASSGTCVHTLNIGRTLLNISFGSTSTHLYTEVGVIAIPSLLASGSTEMAASKPHYQDVSLSPDRVWIVRAGRNLLWIPSEYRPSRSAVSGALVGMGVGSGRIWFCEVK